MLPVLPSLWHREKLHKDVRITLLQCAVALLSDRRGELSSVAWQIVKDCVTTDKATRAGMVLAMVVPALGPKTLNAGSFMSLPSVPHSYYQYGELVTIVCFFPIDLFLQN